MGKRKKPTPQETAQTLRAQLVLARTQLDRFEAELDEVFPIATPRRSVKAIASAARARVVSACRKMLQSRALLIVVFGVGMALGVALS